MLQEKPEKPPEPEITPLPRPRSSSMVAAAPSLVNTHKTQVSSCHQLNKNKNKTNKKKTTPNCCGDAGKRWLDD